MDFTLKIGKVRVLNGLNQLRIFLRLDCQCGYTGMIGINAPLLHAIQINSDLAILLEKNNHLESLIIIGHSFGGLIVTLFSESWESTFPIDAHVIASGLAKSKFDRKYLNCENPKKTKYYISKNVEYKQWRTIKNQDGIFKRLNYDPQVVTFINGETTLLPKKWKGNRVGHNFSILVVSDIILSDLLENK